MKYCKEIIQDDYTYDTITIKIMCTNYCNRKCQYCVEQPSLCYLYNKSQFIDLKQCYIFINSLSNKYKKISIIIYGGEPSFHPDLYDFCIKTAKIDKVDNILIYTNFDNNIILYNSLLSEKIYLSISHHFPYTNLQKITNITLQNILYTYHTILLDNNHINECLNAYSFLLSNIPKHLVDLNLFSDTPYFKSNYTKNDIQLFQSLINKNKKYNYTNYKLKYTYSDNTIDIIDINEDIANKKQIFPNFFHWLCSAGKTNLFIAPDGNIYSCATFFRNRKTMLLNKMQRQTIYQYTTLAFKDILCPFHCCSEQGCSNIILKNIFKFPIKLLIDK